MSTNGARPVSDHTAFGLTPRQYDCLQFIKRYISAHGATPSYDEIAAGLNIAAKSGVHRLVIGLAERGHVWRIPHKRRSARVIDPEGRAVAVEFIRQRILEGSGLLQIMESIDKPVEFVTEGEVIEAVRLAWREMQPVKSEAA